MNGVSEVTGCVWWLVEGSVCPGCPIGQHGAVSSVVLWDPDVWGFHHWADGADQISSQEE